MRGPKQIEFEYNLDNKNRDVIVDQDGTLPCYEVQDILMRRCKTWKVTQVLIQQSDSGPNTLPTLYVSLTDQV
jgi:hypothetical protein